MAFEPKHHHQFSSYNEKGERHTRYVLLLTVITMLLEIIAGSVFGSMALLADGMHMGTHAAAFCITLFAYYYARKHKDSGRFTFGTGKVSTLAGYSSAIFLGVIAVLMLIESLHRLFNPVEIHFNEAIIVAVIGLAVNVASLFLLQGGQSHSHSHDGQEEHTHQDHNLKAAYVHVLADALTSILAIIALFFGKYLGWYFLDAMMGMVGAVLIGKWTIGLIKETYPILLDENIADDYQIRIEKALAPYAEIADIHIWKISAEHHAAILILNSNCDKTICDYKEILAEFDLIDHLTIEIH